jgi:CHAD domain-containing protein
MSDIIELLDQSAPRAARTVALELLEAAAHARTRLDDPSDADALHHFRVSVRRLRSWLRALEPWLEGSTPKKALRRLKKAARITTESRDAEVHLEWLRAQRAALSVRQRHGLAWLVEKIEADKKRSDHAVAAKGVRAFDRAHATLRRKLAVYRVRIDESRDAPESYASVMAALLHDQAAVLARRLSKLESYDETKAVHAARIAGKRLRYLLEPIAEHVENAPRLVAELEQLQDTLGDWHDANDFAAAITEMSDGDVQLGLLALAGRLQARGRKAFAALREQPADVATLLDEVELVVRSLDARSARSGDRRVSEQPEEEPEEGEQRKSGRSDRTDDARIAHQQRAPVPPVPRLEQPAVSESPNA